MSIFLLVSLAAVASARNMVVVNNCQFTIWYELFYNFVTLRIPCSPFFTKQASSGYTLYCRGILPIKNILILMTQMFTDLNAGNAVPGHATGYVDRLSSA